MQAQSAISQQSAANSEALRIEAYHLALGVLSIFETVFPDALTPRMALPVVLDVANGTHDYTTMQVVREWVQSAIDDALVVESETDPADLYPIHAAVMAISAVGMALDPVINLEELHIAVDKALRYAPTQSRRVH